MTEKEKEDTGLLEMHVKICFPLKEREEVARPPLRMEKNAIIEQSW